MLVRANDLMKQYPGAGRSSAVPVLSGVSLQVAAGEFVGIVGPSGSGKSTLLYCLSGLEPVSAGSVELVGVDITAASTRRVAQVRRDRIGFVFQAYNLIPSLTVAENASLQARLAGRRVTRAEVLRVLASVGLEEVADARPGAISGGQQQRTAIARSVLAEPRVIFADEPTGALDATTGAAVIGLLRNAVDESRAVIMVTHDPEAAARTDRVLVLRDGRVQHELTRPTARQVFEAVSAR